MSIKIELTQLPIPRIEFGAPGNFDDPKTGLTQAGPFDLRFGAAHKTQIRVGLVGPDKMVKAGKDWLRRCNTKIPSQIKGSTQYMDFLGFEPVFQSALIVDEQWIERINDIKLQIALTKDPTNRFEEVVNLYMHGIEKLADDTEIRPDIVMCCLPEDVVRTCWSISNILTSRQRRLIKKRQVDQNPGQLLLFDIEETEEDLLNRDFRRALKARTMKFRMPIQIATDNLLTDLSTNQDPATRAWNMSVGLYYKAGGIPWRFKADGPETCFVGISFHHLRTSHSHLVYSSLAQAFSTSGDGFALRGESIPWDEEQDRNVHLTSDQAFNLADQVLQEYRDRTGGNPQRVVLHKTSEFDRTEQEGFQRAFRDIPLIELIHINVDTKQTLFRLLKYGKYPPKIGLLCTVNEVATYLFTTGYIPEWGTYPGPHIPAPIKLVSDGATDMHHVASDILGLARMNWNTASVSSGLPVTLYFSRRVGGIMAEVGGEQPLPSFRYYI